MALSNQDSDAFYQISPRLFSQLLYIVISQISWQIPFLWKPQRPSGCLEKIIDACLQQNITTCKMGKNYATVWQTQIRQDINKKVADAVYQIIKLAGWDINLSAATGYSLMTASILSGSPEFIDIMIKFKYQDKYLVDGKRSALSQANALLAKLIVDGSKKSNSQIESLNKLRMSLINNGIDYLVQKTNIPDPFNRYNGLGLRANIDEYRRLLNDIEPGFVEDMEEHYNAMQAEAIDKLNHQVITISDDSLDGLHGTLAKDIFLILFGECKVNKNEQTNQQRL